MTDLQAGLLQRARRVFSSPNPKKFELLCGISLVTGLGLVELVRCEVRGIPGQQYKCEVVTGIVRSSKGFTLETLLPSDVVLHQLRRLQQLMPSDGLSNKEINLRWSSSAVASAKNWIPGAKFIDLVFMYRTILTKGRSTVPGIGRKDDQQGGKRKRVHT